MGQIASTILLQEVLCFECGVRFAVDATYFWNEVKTGNEIYCPNGHVGRYGKPAKEIDTEKLKAENERLKRELVQAIHDADQAQARKENNQPTDEAELPNSEPAEEKPPSNAKPSYRCETCGKVYKTAGAFGNHVRDIHKLEVTSELLKQSQSA